MAEARRFLHPGGDVGRVRRGAEHAQVEAGGEVLAVGVDDDGTHIPSGVQRPHRRRQLVPEVRVHGVEAVRPVERDAGDMAVRRDG